MGLGMPIPDLSNKPGPGRPGWSAGTYDFQFEVTGAVTIKAQPATTGQSFTIQWPNGTEQTTTGSNSIAAPDGTAGVVSINKKTDNTYADEFAIVGGQTNVSKVLSWGSNPWTDLSSAFLNCTNLTDISTTTLTTGLNCVLTSAFKSCTSLTDVNISSWNMTNAARIDEMFYSCTGLEVFQASNLNLNHTSRWWLRETGTAVTDGCEYKFNGLNITATSYAASNMTQWWYAMKINPASSFANISWPSVTHTGANFQGSSITGVNSTLDCSGWTNYNSGQFPYFQSLTATEGGTSNMKIDITNLNVSTVTSFNRTFLSSNVSEIIGLGDLGATGGVTNAEYAFHTTRFLKFNNHNLSSDFINSFNLGSSNFLQMFFSTGSSLALADASVPPNLHNLDLSSVTDLGSLFQSAKFSSAPDFSNVTMSPTTAYNFTSTFSSMQVNDNSNVNSLFSKTFKVSSFSSTFQNSALPSIIIGNGVDFSPCTTMTKMFQQTSSSTTIELPTNMDLGNLTGVNSFQYFILFGSTLSTCQVDNFIRRLHATALTNGLAIDFEDGPLTESPAVVQSLKDELVSNGWSITTNTTDATIPFEYPAFFAPGTPTTPTNNTGGAFTGIFSSSNSNIPVNSDTGVINTQNEGDTTIRYTLANGCYTEQAITVSDAFQLRIVIPSGGATFVAGTVGGSNYDYNIDWGDGQRTTGITSNTSKSHAYAEGTYTFSVYSSNKDGYNGFNGSNSSFVHEILRWGNLKWTSMQRSFFNCSNLTTMPSSFTLPLRSGAVGVITREAFRGANLTSVNLDGIKIYQDARYMFYGGLNNIQSFSMDNVEFHNANDANSGGDMFSFFGSQNTTSWADFNLNNWTFNNSPWTISTFLGTTSAFYFANEEISMSNWTFTNVPANSTMSFGGGYWGRGLVRKGAASENFDLKLDNWTGTTLYTDGVDFNLHGSDGRMRNFKTTNWDNNTKIKDLYRVFYNSQANSEWEGLNQFIAHETPASRLLNGAFQLSEHKFNSASSSFKPTFLNGITTSYNANLLMNRLSDTSTQQVIEAQYSGYLDFMSSMNDKCTTLYQAFSGGRFLGPLDFGSANLSNVTSFRDMGKATYYQDNKIDMSGVTIDGTTICDFQFMGTSYGSGNGITLDLSSSNISFEGMTSFTFGHSYVGTVNTYKIPQTLTFSSTNFTGGIFFSVNAGYGPTMSTSDYSRLIRAVSDQTTHSNQSIRGGRNQYLGEPTLPSSGSSGPSRFGVNRTGVNYDGGTLNAIVTLESANLNMTSPPTGGTAASVGDLAFSVFYTNSVVNYADVTAIFTTNNTNDSFATDLDNFTSAASGTPWYVNIITSDTGQSIKDLVVDRGWTITDGEFSDYYS